MPESKKSELPDLFAKLCREVNRKLTTGVVSEQILDFAFETISLLIPNDRMGIALLEEDGTLRLSWVKSKLPVRYLSENYAAPAKQSSLESVLRTGEPRILNDLEDYLRQHPESKSTKLILQDGIKSNFTCPLLANNRPIGIVFFSSAKANTYSSVHRDVFMDIANELAIIVEQGRLRQLFDLSKKHTVPLARVVHDLRNPLTIIQGYLDHACRAKWFGSLAPEVKKTFTILDRHAGYMTELLKDISEIRKLSETAPREGRQKVALPFFVDEMIELGKDLAEKKEILLVAEIKNLPEEACFNPVQIRLALENLFSNAIKFSKRHSAIKFTVRKDYNRLVFSVLDHGPGIPCREIPGLFGEFTKSSVRPTEGEPSTGLGLSIVKGIVDLYGGNISVRSEEGKGSEFEFWLPIPGLSREQWDQVIL